jgi:hypothetical protein
MNSVIILIIPILLLQQQQQHLVSAISTTSTPTSSSNPGCFRITNISSTDQVTPLVLNNAYNITTDQSPNTYSVSISEYDCLLKCSICSVDTSTWTVSLPLNYELCLALSSLTSNPSPTNSPTFKCINATDIYAYDTSLPGKESNCIKPGLASVKNPCIRYIPSTPRPTPTPYPTRVNGCFIQPELSSTNLTSTRVTGIEYVQTYINFTYVSTYHAIVETQQSSAQCSMVRLTQYRMLIDATTASNLCVSNPQPENMRCNNFTALTACTLVGNSICPYGYTKMYMKLAPTTRSPVSGSVYGSNSSTADLAGIIVGVVFGVIALVFAIICIASAVVAKKSADVIRLRQQQQQQQFFNNQWVPPPIPPSTTNIPSSYPNITFYRPPTTEPSIPTTQPPIIVQGTMVSTSNLNSGGNIAGDMGGGGGAIPVAIPASSVINNQPILSSTSTNSLLYGDNIPVAKVATPTNNNNNPADTDTKQDTLANI